MANLCIQLLWLFVVVVVVTVVVVTVVVVVVVTIVVVVVLMILSALNCEILDPVWLVKTSLAPCNIQCAIFRSRAFNLL